MKIWMKKYIVPNISYAVVLLISFFFYSFYISPRLNVVAPLRLDDCSATKKGIIANLQGQLYVCDGESYKIVNNKELLVCPPGKHFFTNTGTDINCGKKKMIHYELIKSHEGLFIRNYSLGDYNIKTDKLCKKDKYKECERKYIISHDGKAANHCRLAHYSFSLAKSARRHMSDKHFYYEIKNVFDEIESYSELVIGSAVWWKRMYKVKSAMMKIQLECFFN